MRLPPSHLTVCAQNLQCAKFRELIIIICDRTHLRADKSCLALIVCLGGSLVPEVDDCPGGRSLVLLCQRFLLYLHLLSSRLSSSISFLAHHLQVSSAHARRPAMYEQSASGVEDEEKI
jgi:hypothetical protein